MVEAVVTQPGSVSVRATVRRVGVYLDNHSIISLAKGPAKRRERMIKAFEHGADLMFSPVNAAEVIGPEHRSSIKVITNFLDDIGPYWFPIESDAIAIVDREASGADRSAASTSSWFMSLFFASRNIQLHGEQRLDMVDREFFRLGFVLDWLHPQRSDLRQQLAEFDRRLGEKLVLLESCLGAPSSRIDESLIVCCQFNATMGPDPPPSRGMR